MFRQLAKLGFAITCLVVLPGVASAEECTVVFGFSGDARVSGAVVEVNYARSGVSLPGNGEDVQCHTVAPGVLGMFNDEHDVLNAALIRIEPFGGKRLFACTVSGDDVDASDFKVATVDASDGDSNPLGSLPNSIVSSVECGEGPDLTGDEQYCDVVFTLDTAQRVSGLTYETAYASAGVDPVGAGESVQCKTLVPNGLGTYNDEESTGSLVAAFVHVAGVEGTVDVASCRFAAPNGLDPTALEVAVTDAVDPDGETLEKLPAVFVGELACGTAAELGGGAEPSESGAECDGAYEVTFAVGGSARLGALQVAVGYAGAPGGFAGASESVNCRPDVNASAMFNDKEGVSTLKAGLVATGGFEAPADVFTCVFESTGRAPTPNDFSVEVQDSSDTEGTAVSPEPEVYVSGIVSAGGSECASEPLCGDGVVEGEEECDDGNLDDGDGCWSNCSEVSCGDVDGNGSLTATDAQRVLRDAIGLGTDCTLVRCDVNTSGTVTATDARMVLNASIGLDTSLECAWALTSGL